MDPLVRFLVVLLGAAWPLLLFTSIEAGEVGVNYGLVANDLPDPSSVVNLLKQNGITMVKLFDANPSVLRSLANTGIKVMVMMPNENVAAAAADPSSALRWVQSNVKPYHPATRIDGVAVGNEVFDARPDLTSSLVRAMANVQAALKNLGLAGAIKVSTPIAFSALKASWPPSAGRFRDDIAQPVMKPMLQFLRRTGSYLTINIYPFFAYVSDPAHIGLDYALGNSNPGVDADGLRYYSLLDAQIDATYYAMENLGVAAAGYTLEDDGSELAGVKIRLGETGHPTHGTTRKVKPPRARAVAAGRSHYLTAGDDGASSAASVANAQAYNNNVINRVLAGRTGTPHRPDADMDVYIFALFNENQKGSGPDDIEQNFGLFYPNMQKVYQFDFRGGGAPAGPVTASWCVADAAAGDARLQAALDYACGHGADCGAIQPGGACFEPDTKLAHASYAFNSYYQRNGRAAGTCDFAGAASVVYKEPAACQATASWCVANAAVGDSRLQAALDYACGHGADCSDIQPGAACYDPNTMAAHASHAFNSYYQRNHRASGSCDFAGAATVVYQAPRIGNCVLSAS